MEARDKSPAWFTVTRFYERRVWIEELFGDWRGGDSTSIEPRLHEPATLSRLMLGLSLVYVWLVAVASYVIERGWRPLVGRTSRHARSYPAIGLRWIRWRVRNREPPRGRMRPNF